MPPKKGKKGGSPDAVETIKAVDRTFYELTITDLNQKLANLRAYNSRTDERNLELEANMRRMEEDRTDVTAYLDRTLQEKTNINHDLEEKLSELATVRATETTEFRRQIREQELRYKTMQDELTSEIKLLTGKLNSLEEFRIQKDELLAKFDQQEDELRIQTKNHRELIYDIERKQVIDKDRMKKEVENRLLQLSNEFAKSNEIRISAHVQRLVRENIALNNELDRMMFSQRRLQNENNAMEAEAVKRRATLRSVVEEKDHLIRMSDNQLQVIGKLTSQYEELQLRNAQLAEAMELRVEADKRAHRSGEQMREQQHKVNLLEQHLQASRSECVRHQTVYRQQTKELERLAGILLKLRFSIRSAMKGEASDRDDPEFRAHQRKNLLTDLMTLLLKVQEPPQAVASFETVPSVREIYQSGDIGVSPSISIGTLLKLRKPLGLLQRSRANVADMMEQKEQQALSGVGSYDSFPIIDLDSGSALLLSESSAGEAPPEENEGLEDEDKGVSSSEDEAQPAAQMAAAPQPAAEAPKPPEPESTTAPVLAAPVAEAENAEVPVDQAEDEEQSVDHGEE